MTNDPKACMTMAVETLLEKKGQEVLALDISAISTLADYFIIAHGISEVHVQALADEVQNKLHDAGYIMKSKAGYREAKWVLLDFYDVVIHIFSPQDRHYYMLERLWADAPALTFEQS